jgi:putative Mg2+ transporter-C (MgtC) family protein
MNIDELFRFFDWEILIQILLATILGGAIGLEREFSGRAAGFRTHILVCVGSTIIVLASTAIPRLFGTDYEETLRIDPGRISAGIVTGIGFLGAGAIIRRGDFVRGLTTAACIWFAAALGIVIGMGFYLLALVSTILVLVILRLDEVFEARISTPIYRMLIVRIEAAHAAAFKEKAGPFLKKNGIRIQDMDYAYEREGDQVRIGLYIRTRKALKSGEIVDGLKDEPGLISLRWQN